jgi:hypothetical protein
MIGIVKRDRLIKVLDGWKWIVEMVQQIAPLPVPVRLTKPHRMILKAAPPNQEQIAIRRFDASVQVDAQKARCRHNQRTSVAHRGLEIRFLPRPHSQNRAFQNHSDIFAANPSLVQVRSAKSRPNEPRSAKQTKGRSGFRRTTPSHPSLPKAIADSSPQ